MKEKKIRLKTVQAAKDFVAEAMKCDFDIDVYYNSKFIDGKSIIGVLSLDLRNALTIRSARGTCSRVTRRSRGLSDVLAG